jgi:adenylosuccinate synthase
MARGARFHSPCRSHGRESNHRHACASEFSRPSHARRSGRSVEEQEHGKFGTTERGNGPCYSDKAARSGIRAVDILEPERLRTRPGNDASPQEP